MTLANETTEQTIKHNQQIQHNRKPSPMSSSKERLSSPRDRLSQRLATSRPHPLRPGMQLRAQTLRPLQGTATAMKLTVSFSRVESLVAVMLVSPKLPLLLPGPSTSFVQ